MTWRDEAACRGMSTDIFYPTTATITGYARDRKRKRDRRKAA